MTGPLKVTIELNVPIEHGDDVLTEIVMTEPDLGGLQKMDDASGEMGQTIAMICACTQLPPSVVKQLRLRDMRAISEAAAKLLGEESPSTGGKRQRGSPIASIGRLVS